MSEAQELALGCSRNTVEKNLRTASNKGVQAVTYTQNQKPCLSAFLNHGGVEVSNNFAENATRPFVVGRKNWLFCDTTKGAESSAIVYTLVEMAKVNGLNPHKYLLALLEELPYLSRNTSQEDLDCFLPWQPAVQNACIISMRSDPSGDLSEVPSACRKAACSGRTRQAVKRCKDTSWRKAVEKGEVL